MPYNPIHYRENKEKILARNKKYYEKNKGRVNKYNLLYQKNRYKVDPIYKLKRNIRRRLLLVISGKKKSMSALNLLGCSIQKFKNHIESKFQLGMSWQNHGRFGWHIDHIKPCASFDLTDPEQQKQCFHFSNLQPLWAKENLQKGVK